MRTNSTLRNFLVLGILAMIIYAIINGIQYGSAWGIAMAVCSMIALFAAIHLAGKLSRLQKEEEEQY